MTRTNLLALCAVLAVAGCALTRRWQNPDAKLVAVYHEIAGYSDIVTLRVKSGTLSPDKAQIIHDALAVAVNHADTAKNMILKARGEGRALAPEELRRAWSALDLAADALSVALKAIEAAKEKS